MSPRTSLPLPLVGRLWYRVDTEIASLGVRGISVVFASGDSGTGFRNMGLRAPCTSARHTTENWAMMNYKWIPSRRWLFKTSCLSLPSWQESSVKAWQQTKGARPDNFNASRRCVPDVSIYDAQYYTVQDGSDTVIGHVMAPRASRHGEPDQRCQIRSWTANARFLNPFLYKNKEAFWISFMVAITDMMPRPVT